MLGHGGFKARNIQMIIPNMKEPSVLIILVGYDILSHPEFNLSSD